MKAAGTKIYPAHWMMGRDVSQYISPYTGNVCLPPYYLEYIDEGDYRAQKCWIVYGDYMLVNFGFTKGFATTKSFMQFASHTAKKALIPEGVEEIYGALKNFEQLEEVSLPSTLRVLGDESFYSCRNLESITIPSKVDVIGTDAFWACKKLQNLYIECSTPPSFHDRSNRIANSDIAFNNVFRAIPENAILHVPIGCKQIYQESPVWKEFANIVEDVQACISDISSETHCNPVGIWSIDGHKGKRRGLNIIRYSDGLVRKVITK